MIPENSDLPFSYTVKKSSQAKRVRITIQLDETVTVTIPSRISFGYAEKFLQSKKAWVQASVEKMKLKKASLYKLPKPSISDYKKYKGEALIFAKERLEHFNKHYGFRWRNVTIKNTKSRWGSCSKLQNINFNYRIIFLPPHLADYLVVHELCHLGELNHSPAFWRLVEKTIPNYRDLRNQLNNVF